MLYKVPIILGSYENNIIDFINIKLILIHLGREYFLDMMHFFTIMCLKSLGIDTRKWFILSMNNSEIYIYIQNIIMNKYILN